MTNKDQDATSYFMAEAFGNPEKAQHLRHIDSCSDVVEEPFISTHVEKHWDIYFLEPYYPGFSENED